jgi:hypothetical protein
MLRRIVAFLSVLLLLVGGASAGDEPKFDQFPAGKVYKGSAQCLLEIESKTYISGPCIVDSRNDRITITSLANPDLSATIKYDAIKFENPNYSASTKDDPIDKYILGDSAEWTEGVGSHKLLGAVIKEGSCFTNDADGIGGEEIYFLNSRGARGAVNGVEFPPARICVYLTP